MDLINTLTPKQVYNNKRNWHTATQEQLKRKDRHLATARVLIALVVLALLWLSFVAQSLDIIWPLLSVAVFVVLIVAHRQTIKQLKQTRRIIDYYSGRLDQLAGLRPKYSNTGTRYQNAEHPYSEDLDLFGEGSLFELLCGARTKLGQDTLAQWLCGAASLETIKQRQQALGELRNQHDFREQLILLKTQAHEAFDQRTLLQWAETPAQPIHRWQRTVAILLGVLALASLIIWVTGYGLLPLLLVSVIEVIFYATTIRQIRQTAVKADAASAGLELVSQVLDCIEQTRFESTLLQQLRSDLQTQEHPPSWQTRRLRQLIQMLNNCLQNQLVAPLAFMLGVPLPIVHRINHWQQNVGPHIAQWFNVVGQIEALHSLARYAFENPEYPYPQLIADTESPCFTATALGHPLITFNQCVANDIHLDAELSLIMVSGSNMSGKSTLLRSIGVNLTLALCGAPVRAKDFKTSRFMIGSVMHASDSLQQGASLFYSVISQIKRVVELAGQSPPLFFLLDEILQGTNSHDRRIGAEGIIRQLINQNAMGLVTTHDLALTTIADSLGDRAKNIHFEDQLVNGQMHFDYTIRPGVVQKSNALALMQMAGLDVGKHK